MLSIVLVSISFNGMPPPVTSAFLYLRAHALPFSRHTRWLALKHQLKLAANQVSASNVGGRHSGQSRGVLSSRG